MSAICSPTRFECEGRAVEVRPAASPGRPLVCLNAYGETPPRLPGSLPDCSWVTVTRLRWDHDLSPWPIPAIAPGDTPCTGGADDYLRLLLERILPRAEALCPGPVTWYGLGGYSLAGLFALYALFNTARFSRVASVSGSLWFPDFDRYLRARPWCARPARVYLSLGDREALTGNPYLRTVRARTEDAAAFFRERDVTVRFDLNPGDHFHEPLRRTRAGMRWLLDDADD